MIEIIPYLRSMFLKRIVTLFITLLILFADSGQMIYAHTCFKSNKTSLSLYTPDDCCDKEVSKKSCCAKKVSEHKDDCTIGDKACCSVSSKYVKQAFPNNEVKLSVAKVIKHALAEVNLFSAYVAIPQNKISFHSSVPLLRCKDDIRFTGVFRI